MRVAPRSVGQRGEEAAAAWYVERGFEVVARNWRCPSGELDLVCARSGTVVVCEVKSRTTDRFGAPVEAVTALKQARVRRAAAAWLSQGGLRCRTVRFDVAGVTPAGVDVTEGAF
ncbi:MAG: YraN family protein [Acidimicrobiales bacterium]